ncbi:MAG: hypothetical protein Q9180_003715, partial [Flavoplaca navasiana]
CKMEQPRELWAKDKYRPDRDNNDYPDYHLIRVYSLNSVITLEEKPTKEIFEDDLKLKDGDVLWICKDVDTRKDWGSYFVLIHRKADAKIDWKNCQKYRKANRLWNPPTNDWRENFFDPSKGVIESFIGTAARESWRQHISIAKFFAHAFSEFKTQMPGETNATANYKEGLEAWKAEAEDRAEEEAEAKTKKSGKKPA